MLGVVLGARKAGAAVTVCRCGVTPRRAVAENRRGAPAWGTSEVWLCSQGADALHSLPADCASLPAQV